MSHYVIGSDDSQEPREALLHLLDNWQHVEDLQQVMAQFEDQVEFFQVRQCA